MEPYKFNLGVYLLAEGKQVKKGETVKLTAARADEINEKLLKTRGIKNAVKLAKAPELDEAKVKAEKEAAEAAAKAEAEAAKK